MLAVLHCDGASGFVSSPFQRTSPRHGRTSSELNDSLFDDIFESEPSNRRDVEQEPPKNYNEDAAPFSELESDQDRARRMEMVRELQQVYYNHKQPNSSSDSSS